uniref:Uncharacterized protein n=1 Tax=Picea glauca TaxID=3330 RepID=A0A117NGV1_PICGL|nr:hypothetical protein ABT39_MTgene5558 [Picea glauca]
MGIGRIRTPLGVGSVIWANSTLSRLVHSPDSPPGIPLTLLVTGQQEFLVQLSNINKPPSPLRHIPRIPTVQIPLKGASNRKKNMSVLLRSPPRLNSWVSCVK